MPSCDVCGEQVDLPYDCKGCSGTFCSEHRLPENHDCAGLADWGGSGGTFDSGFDDRVVDDDDGLLDRLGIDTGRTGLHGYVRNNMTFVFLGLMWVTFFAQNAVAYVLEPFGSIQATMLFNPTYEAIFVLTPEHPEYVWTWVTSVFAHGGFFHIVFNSIVIYFFGRIVEQYVGSRDYSLLFLASGIVAGLGQIAIITLQTSNLATAPGVVGASGAGLALMGVLTILNPGMRVLLYFVVPVPIWVLTLGYAGISVLGLANPVSGGGVADGAHLIGLLIGLAYGLYVKDDVQTSNRVRLGGGPGPGGPGGPGGSGGRGPF